MKTRSDALEQIARNIRDHGYHAYVVSGGPMPRWIYTIGLSPSLGYELIFAGGALYPKDEVLRIVQDEVTKAQSDKRFLPNPSPGMDGFQLGSVCPEWAMQLLIGANDFYQTHVAALQILPDQFRRTIDVPDLSAPLAVNQATSWRWLQEPWPYQIPKNAEAMTDLPVLMGARVTEVARWEEGYWEAFSGPSDEVSREDAFLVPLGTLLGADPSLEASTKLDIGKALCRGQAGDWQPWG